MLIDTHCHLDFPDFAEDFPAILARAKAAGLQQMITISTRVRRFAQIKAIAEANAEVFCSVGTHPHSAGDETDVTVEELVQLASYEKCVAIGEAGLDYFYDKAPRDDQARGLRIHIEAARITQLPLVIHARDADDDMIAILSDEMAKGTYPALLHCFSSGQKLADAGVELGLYVSFSGILTFKRSEDIRAIARTVPLDRLLVETDAPYLAPMPHRGKRNEPSYVAHTAAVLAETMGLTVPEIQAITTANALRCFNKMPDLSREVA